MDHIIHAKYGRTLQYALDGSGWTATAKNTYTDLRQGYVQLFYDDVEQLTAKQSNICLHLLSTPLRAVGLEIRNPYLIESEGKPLGEIRYKGRCSTMSIYGQTYEYRIHSQYISSLVLGEQLGVSYLPNDQFADRASWRPED